MGSSSAGVRTFFLLFLVSDKLITRPGEYYRLWCVVVCDLENLKNQVAVACVASQFHKEKKFIIEQETKFRSLIGDLGSCEVRTANQILLKLECTFFLLLKPLHVRTS